MTNKTSKQKLSCPFCGDRDVRAHHRGHPTAGEWVIECHGCSCELTGFASEQDAWKTWNGRWNPTPDETSVVLPDGPAPFRPTDEVIRRVCLGGMRTTEEGREIITYLRWLERRQAVEAARRTDTRLAGDIEYCLAKINPSTDVHAILTEVMKDLRSPEEPSPCMGMWHVPVITCAKCGTALKQCSECRVISGHRYDCSTQKAPGRASLACVHRDGCRKFPACMVEARCCGNDASIPETR